jgi:hypothetical protein
MTPAEIAAEYIAASEAWRSWCVGSQAGAGEDAPIVVLLLSALGEPPSFGERFTGDLVTDLLGVAQGTTARWRASAEGPSAIEGWELKQLERRLDTVIELRRRALAGGGR